MILWSVILTCLLLFSPLYRWGKFFVLLPVCYLAIYPFIKASFRSGRFLQILFGVWALVNIVLYANVFTSFLVHWSRGSELEYWTGITTASTCFYCLYLPIAESKKLGSEESYTRGFYALSGACFAISFYLAMVAVNKFLLVSTLASVVLGLLMFYKSPIYSNTIQDEAIRLLYPRQIVVIILSLCLMAMTGKKLYEDYTREEPELNIRELPPMRRAE